MSYCPRSSALIRIDRPAGRYSCGACGTVLDIDDTRNDLSGPARIPVHTPPSPGPCRSSNTDWLDDDALGWLGQAIGEDAQAVGHMLDAWTDAGIVVDFTFPEPDGDDLAVLRGVA